MTTVTQLDTAGPWYAGVKPKYWRTLWGSYLGWIIDGYEAYALVVALPLAMRALLTPEQVKTLPYYAWPLPE